MKNYLSFKLFSVLLLIFISQGCKKDILDTIPNDRISSEIYWKTETDAISAVNGIYQSLDAVNLFVLDGVSDIGHTNTTFTAEYNIENGTFDASHSRIQTEWQNGYRGIFLANFVLENIDKVTTSNTTLINRLKG
jgi:hypothetical protein